MTSREIIKAIVKEKTCPERMGLFEHFWGDTQEEWEKQGLPKGIDFTDYFNYDFRFVPGTWFNTESFVIPETIVESDGKTKIIQNGWGAKLRYWMDRSGTPEHIYYDLINEEIWKDKYRSNLLELNVKRFDNIEQIKKDYTKFMAEDKFVVFNNMFIFEIMRKSIGDVVMLESMYLAPDFIHDFCNVVTNCMIKHYEFLFKEVGIPDGFWLYEDMGYTRAPFISPKCYKEMIFPYHKRMVDFIHSYNIPLIMHSCGKVEPLLPHIADTGVDCLQVLEAKAGQNVINMAKTVNNKMAFIGNLNILAYESNDHTKIDEEILPKLKGIKENRIPYVFHSDHSIPKTVKLDTYKYTLELYQKNCRY